MLTIIAVAILASPFAPLEGHWSCSGRFVASGAPIVSELTMKTDPVSGVFIVRHDDSAPMPYHSVEIWTADLGGRALHAAVADSFSGLRVFTSPPARDGVLTFGRPDGVDPHEQFRYALTDRRTLQVDWSVAQPDQPLRLADTLTCTRKDN